MVPKSKLDISVASPLGNQVSYPVLAPSKINAETEDAYSLLDLLDRHPDLITQRQVDIPGGWGGRRLTFRLHVSQPRIGSVNHYYAYGYSEAIPEGEELVAKGDTKFYINRIITVREVAIIQRAGTKMISSVIGDVHLLDLNSSRTDPNARIELLRHHDLYNKMSLEEMSSKFDMEGCRDIIDARRGGTGISPINVLHESVRKYTEVLHEGLNRVIHDPCYFPHNSEVMWQQIGDGVAPSLREEAFIEELRRSTDIEQTGHVTYDELMLTFNPEVTTSIPHEHSPRVHSIKRIKIGGDDSLESFIANELFNITLTQMSVYGLEACGHYGEIYSNEERPTEGDGEFENADMEQCDAWLSHVRTYKDITTYDDVGPLTIEENMMATIRTDLNDLANRCKIEEINYSINLDIRNTAVIEVSIRREDEPAGAHVVFYRTAYASALTSGLVTTDFGVANFLKYFYSMAARWVSTQPAPPLKEEGELDHPI